MIKNYLKTAFQNIKRHSTYSILNISGMAIGMASAILILLWVKDEFSFDRHFKNANDLFRIIVNETPSGGEVSLMAPTPAILPGTLKEQYPEIIRSSRYEPHFELRIKKEEEVIQERSVAAVDKDFLKMFNIDFVSGDINNALNAPHNVILTQEMAHKYFGEEDALGKTLPVSLGYTMTVTGVVKSVPPNSHIGFDFIIPIEILEESGVPINDWTFLCYNYLQLKKGTDSKIVNDKIRWFIKENKKGADSEICLQNIKKIHLFSSRKYTFDIGGNGDITYVRIMILIAVFILLIACINFMNLYISQSIRRAKEIGVRKAMGATKSKITLQFLGESLLVVFVAHIIAMIIVELLLPGFNNFTGKQLIVNYKSAGLYTSLISIVLFYGFLAGSYPALYLSSLKSLEIMTGVTARNPGNTQFRRVLVILQFSISIVLVICTLIVGEQLKFIQKKNLGYNKDNIVYFQFPTAPWDPKLNTLKQVLVNNPNILNVTKVFYNYANPLNIEGPSGGFNWAGKKTGDDVLFNNISADEDYAKTFQLEIKKGRYFSTEFSKDNNAIVINEQAAKILGFKEPVGEIITSTQGTRLNIIGIVKDFHFKSLHSKIEPLIMKLGESNNFFIRMKPENIVSTVEFIKKTYNSFKPEIPLDFHFLEDDFNKLYRTEQRISKIFGYFSLLAIIISCLGLIGLSSFMTELRTKEIGIRKINGAKTIEIFSLLLGQYIKWVLISVIIACPIALYSMHKWLQNFAYRINISWWIIELAGAFALLIAFVTVSFISYKAASKNPVETLRYE